VNTLLPPAGIAARTACRRQHLVKGTDPPKCRGDLAGQPVWPRLWDI